MRSAMPARANAWYANSIWRRRGRNGPWPTASMSCCAGRTRRRWPPSMPERTPSQTVGPYLHLALAPRDYNFRELFGATLAEPGLAGTHIRIEGRVSDGEGLPLPDALIEIWQADAHGRYAHPADG